MAPTGHAEHPDHEPTRAAAGDAAGPRVDATAVERAAAALAGVVGTTPVHESARLSAATGARVWLKREDLQLVRSYKVRGAYNLICERSARPSGRGASSAPAPATTARASPTPAAASACAARVFLPPPRPARSASASPPSAASASSCVVVGEHLRRGRPPRPRATPRATGAIHVPAFDDPRTDRRARAPSWSSCAQGGAGRRPDTVFVPVGGGGLVAGGVAWLRARRPGTTRRRASSRPAPRAWRRPSAAGEPVALAAVDTFVDGAAVRPRGRRAPSRSCATSGRRGRRRPRGAVCSRCSPSTSPTASSPSRRGPSPAAPCGVPAAGDAVPGRRSCASSRGATTTSAATARWSSGRCVHEGRKPLLPGRLPPGAGGAAPLPRRGPRARTTTSSLFEYVKKNNRETGPALVGIELGRPGRPRRPCSGRMEASAAADRAGAAGLAAVHLPALSGSGLRRPDPE